MRIRVGYNDSILDKSALIIELIKNKKWGSLRDSLLIFYLIRARFHRWNVQNVIDPKDQMTFKVLPVEPQLRGGELYKYQDMKER